MLAVTAAAGPIRFTELERTIEGISRRMLTHVSSQGVGYGKAGGPPMGTMSTR